MIPGLRTEVTVNTKGTGYLPTIGLGGYLKYFVTKHFALVPHLKVSNALMGFKFILGIDLGLGLRQYF